VDFVTVHNILYYIYTGCVNLHVPLNGPKYITPPEGYPDEADPFRLYRSADKFLLHDLKGHCFHYIKAATGDDPRKAIQWLFDYNCGHHDELREHCLGRVLARYDELKESEEWRKVVLNEEDVPPSVRQYQERILYEISMRLTHRDS